MQLSLLHRSGRCNKSKPERFKQKKYTKKTMERKGEKERTDKKEWNWKQIMQNSATNYSWSSNSNRQTKSPLETTNLKKQEQSTVEILTSRTRGHHPPLHLHNFSLYKKQSLPTLQQKNKLTFTASLIKAQLQLSSHHIHHETHCSTLAICCTWITFPILFIICILFFSYPYNVKRRQKHDIENAGGEFSGEWGLSNQMRMH